MSGPAVAQDLCVCFPAAGGAAGLGPLTQAAARLGLTTLALPNAGSVDDFDSGRWHARTTEEIRRAAARGAARRIVLTGHSMGGLSAVCLQESLGASTGVPTGVLIVSTPCPDPSGRVPTMSQLTDAQIARLLAHDGFPQEVLDDPDMLAEIARGLRGDARVGDRLAEAVARAGRLTALHVLSGRDDRFITPDRCAAWRHRVSGEFHLTVAPGGHGLHTASGTALARALGGLLAATGAEGAAA